MNKWYKSGLAKGILIVAAHVLSVTLVISILWMASYPDVAEDMLSGKKTGNYLDTEGFSKKVYSESMEILHLLGMKRQIETEGQLDGDKIVDVEEYFNNNRITNENTNGLAYRLEDLNNWGEAINDGGVESGYTQDETENPIIVCQKTDNSYEYYYYDELKALLENGELSFVMEDSSYTSTEALRILVEDSSYNGESLGVKMVQDKEGRVKYVNCWTYDGYWTEEKYKPLDAQNLLEIVNTNEKWNGRLSEAFDMIHSSALRIYNDVNSYQTFVNEWTEGNANLTYLFVDEEEKKVYTNVSGYTSYDDVEKNLEKIRADGKYVIVKPKLADFDSNMEGISAKDWVDVVKDMAWTDDNFVFAMKVDTAFPIQDTYYTQAAGYEEYAPTVRRMMILGGVSGLLLLVILVWLTAAAGRRPGDDELHLHFFDRWKTEIAAALVIGAWCLCMMLLATIWPTTEVYVSGDWVTDASGMVYYSADRIQAYDIAQVIVAGACAALTCLIFLIGYLSLVRRIKAKSLWKDSLLRWLIHSFRKLFRNIHSVWKIVLLYGGFILLHWFALGGNGMFVFLMFAAEILAFVYLMRRVIGRKRIRTGIMRIAGGEVDYQIPLQGLYGEQLEIAERVNTIGEGLDAAVEVSMKNERLKTDLITNVAHDIKTPLTSIINYIYLLKKENFTDPKIQGYLDVLEAKAQRLKTLTEDVVEASKVSSGNISLEYTNINLVEMIQQVSGEFAEKFQSRNLKEIVSLPEEEAVIRVDGRRMWRVLENIYNNAAKYAMEGTRIYADLRVTQTEVNFSLKNVSEQPLNIEADELTERFVRGDVSRSTEGSGLGLSIAKSLTTMQGGKFELYLDGDLFRVTITFPRMVK